MKKLTATFDDKTDLGPIFNALGHAKELKLETINSEPAVKHRKHRGAKTGISVIMSHYTPEGEFHYNIAQDWLEKEGFSRTSTSPMISRLIKDDYLKRLDGHRFRFVREYAE